MAHHTRLKCIGERMVETAEHNAAASHRLQRGQTKALTQAITGYRFEFDVPPDEFVTAALNTFDDAVSVTDDVPQGVWCGVGVVW